LRYPLPRGSRVYWGPGGLAAPGSYLLRLTANGKSSAQPLTIRWIARETPQAALVRQFDLASNSRRDWRNFIGDATSKRTA